MESWISPLKVIFQSGIEPLKVEYYRWKWNSTFNFSICINRSWISCRVNSQQTTNPITRITVKVSKDNHWDIHWINPLRHIYPQVQLTIPQTFVLIDILWTLTLDYTSLYKVLFNRLTKFPTNHLVTSYTKTDLLFTLWIVSLSPLHNAAWTFGRGIAFISPAAGRVSCWVPSHSIVAPAEWFLTIFG